MTKEIKPIIDETYWRIYQIYTPPYSYNFVLHEIFHFNSLTCNEFLTTRSPYEQLKKTYIHLPERIIQNSSSDIFIKNKNILIKKEIPFIQIVDGYKWIINKEIIIAELKNYENIII
jgi:hypothetical protein